MQFANVKEAINLLPNSQIFHSETSCKILSFLLYQN